MKKICMLRDDEYVGFKELVNESFGKLLLYEGCERMECYPVGLSCLLCKAMNNYYLFP